MKTTAIVIVAGLVLGLFSGLPFRRVNVEPPPGQTEKKSRPVSKVGAKSEDGATRDPLYKVLAAADQPRELSEAFDQLMRDALRNPLADTALLELCASRWAESDPEAMLAYLLKGNLLDLSYIRTPRGLDLADLLFGTWTENDPQAAAQAAAELATHPTRANGIGFHKVFWKAFEIEPQTAKGLILAHPEMQLAIGFDERPPTSPSVGVFELLASLPDSSMRSHALGKLPFGMTSSEAEVSELWAWFDGQDASVQTGALASLFTAQRRMEHPVERLETMKTLSIGSEPLSRRLISGFGLELARRDLEGTESWIRENFAGNQEFHLMRQLQQYALRLAKEQAAQGDN